MAVNSYSSCEQVSLIGELTQGLDLAKQLKAHMGQEVSSQTQGMLLENILSSYEKSLLILKWVGSVEQSPYHVVPPGNMPGSPISIIRNPKGEDLNPGSNAQHDSRDFSRKRKMMCSWTKQEKVSTDNALEGPPDDGYSWRKYGQKDILGAKHPRSYYRCTYRNIHGCYATKQVQRNDKDPTVFDITYKGTHTCTPVLRSKSAPTTPEKQEHKRQHIFPTTEYQQLPDVMLNFHSGLSVDIQSVEDQAIIGFPLSTTGSGYENHPFYNSFQQSFVLSPATSGSNYFGGVHHGEHDESDIAEIISATTSSTNSPIISSDFPLDQLEFNPGFPYDNQDIFSQLLSS